MLENKKTATTDVGFPLMRNEHGRHCSKMEKVQKNTANVHIEEKNPQQNKKNWQHSQIIAEEMGCGSSHQGRDSTHHGCWCWCLCWCCRLWRRCRAGFPLPRPAPGGGPCAAQCHCHLYTRKRSIGHSLAPTELVAEKPGGNPKMAWKYLGSILQKHKKKNEGTLAES